MKPFYVPTSGVGDWQKLLADPNKHWRKGFSARSLAYAWESAKGFPSEIQALFNQSNNPAFQNINLLMAIPEHKVLMPPNSGHPSQNDLFILAKDHDGNLIAMTIEGKASESFDKTLAQWNVKGSKGKDKRLAFIKETLGLTGEIPLTVRYQLLHRTVSAILEARRFNARVAVMLVHSFSQSDQWFENYQEFLKLFNVTTAKVGSLYLLTETQGVKVFSGWARGDEKFTLT